MKTRAQINMNYREAIQQASDLDTLAGKVRSTANQKIEQSMQLLSSGWKGNNANEFLRKYGLLKQQILDSADELNAIADDIRRTAKIVYEAEMAALQIAQTRKS
ncbi:MAG: WXG100 family type VII secretion target [Eubacteriales bacterium]|nr:WXG100 family type VII secretion target [Eubacteriales bacterium]